jgi:thiol-disulfide isomerase/thioredoxin
LRNLLNPARRISMMLRINISILFVLLVGLGFSCSKESGSKTAEPETSLTETAEKESAPQDTAQIETAGPDISGTKTSVPEKTVTDPVKAGSAEKIKDDCIPCKMMQPVMKEIEKEYAGQVQVVFHDVWTQEGQPYAEQYRIRVIPTQVFLDREGKEYFRHEGFFAKEDLVKVLRQKGVQ